MSRKNEADGSSGGTLAEVLSRARVELASVGAFRMRAMRERGMAVDGDGLLAGLVVADSLITLVLRAVVEGGWQRAGDLIRDLEAELGMMLEPLRKARPTSDDVAAWSSVVEQVQLHALARMRAAGLEAAGATVIMTGSLEAERPVAAMATTLPSRAAVRGVLGHVIVESLLAEGVPLEEAGDAAMRDVKALLAVKVRNGG